SVIPSLLLFFFMSRPPPSSTLFPYTTLFRSEAHVGDGGRYGLRVHYLVEDRPLHTAGVLSLLPSPPPGPLFVINAKLVTSLRFRSEEHTSELQSRGHLVCRLLLEKKKKKGSARLMTKTTIGDPQSHIGRW